MQGVLLLANTFRGLQLLANRAYFVCTLGACLHAHASVLTTKQLASYSFDCYGMSPECHINRLPACNDPAPAGPIHLSVWSLSHPYQLQRLVLSWGLAVPIHDTLEFRLVCFKSNQTMQSEQHT